MFEELSDLVRTENETCTRTADQQVPDTDSKQAMLDGTNYSWCARNGMKVVIDTESKSDQPSPSLTMYDKKIYTSHNSKHVVVSAYEDGGTDKHCRRHVSSRSINGENSTDSISSIDSHKPDAITSENSPVSDSLLREEDLGHSHVGKRVKQYPVCNGCISHDVKAEVNEQRCESTDSYLSEMIGTNVENKSRIATIKHESAIDRKVAKSTLDLEELEAKLSLSRKRR